MKRILVSLLSALILTSLAVVPAFAVDPIVTITATPTYISFTNSEDAWAMGVVAVNTSYWWTAAGTAPAPEPFEANDMKSTITNTGTVAIDIEVHSHNFTTSGATIWTLHGTVPGLDIIVLSCGVTGCTDEATMIDLVDTTAQHLTTNLAAAGTIKWCMLLKTGTFGDGAVRTGVVTVSAHAT
jgi:hypothetical protein